MDEEVDKEAAKTRVSALVSSVPGNEICADCGDPDPKWTSSNLGIFICIECSGIHRRMGTGISKVRSLVLDNWDNELAEAMEAMGNVKSNAIFQAQIPRCFPCPKPDSDIDVKGGFIRAKYEDKAFVEGSGLAFFNGEDAGGSSGWLDAVHCGDLFKRGTVNKSWKQRWFVLNPLGQLFYFKTKQDLIPAGVIDCRMAVVTLMDETHDKFDTHDSQFMLSIQANDREYILVGESNKDVYAWTVVIEMLKWMTANGGYDNVEMETTDNVSSSSSSSSNGDASLGDPSSWDIGLRYHGVFHNRGFESLAVVCPMMEGELNLKKTLKSSRVFVSLSKQCVVVTNDGKESLPIQVMEPVSVESGKSGMIVVKGASGSSVKLSGDNIEEWEDKLKGMCAS